jgi:hypothetical protein
MQPISPMMSEYILGNIIDQFPDLHRHVGFDILPIRPCVVLLAASSNFAYAIYMIEKQSEIVVPTTRAKITQWRPDKSEAKLDTQ